MGAAAVARPLSQVAVVSTAVAATDVTELTAAESVVPGLVWK